VLYEVPALLDAVHGLLIHEHLTWVYGVEHRPEHKRPPTSAPAEDLLGLLLTDDRRGILLHRFARFDPAVWEIRIVRSLGGPVPESVCQV
jgi:hypothetical protein